MWRTSLAIPALEGPGLLQRPDERASVRGGVVALHGASLPQRDQPLFQHLAQILTPLGYAVLSYDRRSASDGNDTPLEVQAEDALAAVATLAAEIHAPVGLYGFSQGAWAAALAASASEKVSFLVLLGSCGVSPAVQMRFYTDELLRRAGYDDAARAQLRALRLAVEDVLRGQGDRERDGRPVGRRGERAMVPPGLPASRAADTGRAAGTTWTMTRNRRSVGSRVRPC